MGTVCRFVRNWYVADVTMSVAVTSVTCELQKLGQVLTAAIQAPQMRTFRCNADGCRSANKPSVSHASHAASPMQRNKRERNSVRVCV